MPDFFEKIMFDLEAFSYIRMTLTLGKQLMLPQNIFSILMLGSPVCAHLIPLYPY